MKTFFLPTGVAKWIGAAVLLGLLTACSSGPEKIKPTALAPDAALVGVRLAWSAKIGPQELALETRVNGSTVTLASSDGSVAAFDAGSGAQLWRTNVGSKISAGVGSDGQFAALVTRGNELVMLEGGRELWRQKLPAQSFTAPLVAGARVFVLSADRSVSAFDARSGQRLWLQSRAGESLVLRQAGVLLAHGDTLVAGLSGRLVGLSPLNGSVRWEAPIATPRGTNDIERLVDLIGPAQRSGDVICARAFQAALGCVNARRGALLWSNTASGSTGLAGDDVNLYGIDSDDKIVAWRRSDGQRGWVAEQLRYRHLSPGLVVGRSLVVGDENGLVHWLARTDGTSLTRRATDNSAIQAAPVLAGGTLVVVTRNGGIFGFRPD